jgi:oxaloacetate decarboxylase alpha subunit
MTRAVDIVDTTTRDGNQSLWGATGLTAGDILAIAPTLERVGYHALDFTSSTHMAVSVRFHREDPWELTRLMRAAMPSTLLNFITTGMRFIAWQPCDEDVMRLAFRCVVRNGIRRFQFAEPANDPEALRRVARMAREEGVEEIVVGLTYSISPVHTHAYYAERVAALADCADIDRFYLKDPGGLLTTDAVRDLAPHFVATGRTIELHSHCTIGLAPVVYLAGLEAGFHVLHTAIGPAGNGTSQPTVESTLRNLEAEGYTHRLDAEALGHAGEYFRELVRVKGLPPGAPREYDAAYYHHQLPGGMVTTTRRMLGEIGRPELYDAVLHEVVRVRAEMGYPILVTPVSQLVAYQATRNVIDPERWVNVSDETVRYFLGHYGEFAAPPDPDVVDRVLSLAKVEKLRDAKPVSLEGARARFGDRISDEELLLRLTMPEDQVDAMRASPPLAERPVRTPITGGDPLVRLLREVERRRSISYLRVRKGDDLVVWRRAS